MVSLTGSKASLEQQVRRLTASQEALTASREAWQSERQHLANLLTDVQQSSQVIQTRHEAELTVLRADLQKARAAQTEAETQLSQSKASHIARLQEVSICCDNGI